MPEPSTVHHPLYQLKRTPFHARTSQLCLPHNWRRWGGCIAAGSYDLGLDREYWAIRNHAALKGLDIPRTGRAGRIGTLVTKTLLIAGEAGFFTNPAGRRGAMLRAYDKVTGKDAGAVFMPAPQSGSPMTYLADGKQFIVVAISGGNYTGELLAFAVRQ